MNGTPTNYPMPSQVAMVLIYQTLWKNLKRKSVVSGLWLRTFEGTPLFPNIFCHVLPVDKYPYFKYYMANIALMTPGETALWKNGTEEARIQYALDLECVSRNRDTANWNVVKYMEELLIAQYNKTFPYTNKGIVGYEYPIDTVTETIGKLNKKYILSLK